MTPVMWFNQPANMTPEVLQSGYWRAYREFYRWRAIFKGAATKPSPGAMLRHIAYAGGWKKFEPLWNFVIRAGQISRFLPLLETILGNSQSVKIHSHIKESIPEPVDFHQRLKDRV